MRIDPSFTEEDVKHQYITPAIARNWDIIKMEYPFTDGRVIVRGKTISRGKRKRVDYLLFSRPNLPLAIVEAKDGNHALGAGMQQGIGYAIPLDVPFVYSSNGTGFLEHDMLTGKERELALAEFPTPEELWDRYKAANQITPAQEELITEPYDTGIDINPPRYYQQVAINRVVDAISKGHERILLVMATGTGKTYTAFQIIWRLWKSRRKKKILYLADRNILIDQTMMQDFKPFKSVMTKIKGKELDSSYEIYMSLYQQLAGDEGEEPFREFQRDFFDLIIVDECHRGSAKEDSQWRRILEYFSSATQIGMTATPKQDNVVDTVGYFGEPVYTYSLKQGIDDGFLAPYKVIRVNMDKDVEGWRPYLGQTDVEGNLIEDREYNITDYDRNLVIDERTTTVAKRITAYLIETDRFNKTIVFCVDTEHAERMRQALVNANSDLVARNSKYVMRITGDDQEGKAQLENFIDVNELYPVVVTTSKLLSTGVDCKTCHLIVLESVINSMVEFKQIIGRGTRLVPSHGKHYFTIMDFRNATRLFADPDFDGEPISVVDVDDEGGEETLEISPSPDEPIVDLIDDNNGDDEKKEPRDKIRVNGVEVTILNERVQYYDKNGKLITESITDYSKRNIREGFATLKDFLAEWNSERRKQVVIDELQERGVLIDALRESAVSKDWDDFDLICHIAYDKKPLTKAERANNVKKRDYLSRYEGLAREVLTALLDKYTDEGPGVLEGPQVLGLDPFRTMGAPTKIVSAFGGRGGFLRALDGLQAELYREAA